MVLFALTKHGLSEMLDLVRDSSSAMWLNDGLLDATSLDGLGAEGLDLTNFARWVAPANEAAVQNAVQAIRKHHPNQVIYVERI